METHRVEMLRLSYFLDNWLTGGCEVVGLTRFTSQEDSWYSFLLEPVDPRAIVQLQGLGKFKKNQMTSLGIEPTTFWLLL
jgi:hypothetical protein